MTISFPRTLPAELTSRLSTCSFELDWMQEYAPTRGGLIIARDLGPALWMASFQSAKLQPANYKTVDAWLKSLSGSLNPFYGYDLARQNALAYPAGYTGLTRANAGGSFDGTCLIAGIGGDNVTMTLGSIGAPSTTLPSAFVLTIGDYVAFDYTSNGVTVRALHQVVAGGTADSNGVLAVEVRPNIRSGAATMTALLNLPSGKFLLDPKSVKTNLFPAGYGTIGFQGIQTLG